jgi:hypothetical protein
MQATLNDMGDKTISVQVKIDGAITPDFSYDWEVEFDGETYIQPLREPQASKGNDSINSTIDLVFYHKVIYDLKRYFFIETTSVGSGTTIADKYIASLDVNIESFCVALQNVLNYYYNGKIDVELNSDTYDQTTKYIEINYTHIWDVLQKVYEVFGVRWNINGTTIEFGFATEQVEHLFEYGFEGGLLKVERQVQNADIRNSLLGRGGERNLPYRYFKDSNPKNPSFKADPDWIPELANIYFTEMRGKTFRDYVRGWKAKHYDGEPMVEPTEAYTKGYTDKNFNPIEFVEDKDSIAKYGLLQGGLDNQEDIYPSIQGVEVERLGRVDEVVAVEKVMTDALDGGVDSQNYMTEIKAIHSKNMSVKEGDVWTIQVTSDLFTIPEGYEGRFTQSPTIKAWANTPFTKIDYRIITDASGKWKTYEAKSKEYKWNNLQTELLDFSVIEHESDKEVDWLNLPPNKELKLVAVCKVSGFFGADDHTSIHPDIGLPVGWELVPDSSYKVNVTFTRTLDYSPFHGEYLANTEDDNFTPISASEGITPNAESSIELYTEEFVVPEEGSTLVDVPINIVTDENLVGMYTYERDIKAYNVETGEISSSINIPQGTYKCRVRVTIKNNSSSWGTFTVQLLPMSVVYPSTSDKWIPTFDIWIKNIWNSTRNEGETDAEYAERVWRPILGDRQGNEAKVVFATGFLSGHEDYEFTITDFAYDNSALLREVPSEWRLTLAKSDAELEATGLYIPNATTGGNAIAGDKFYFVGIDMPHEYVLWAEERLDAFKRKTLGETANIKPTWVVQVDKVRLNELQEGESELLLNALKVGNSIKLADKRFIESHHETLYLRSVTYSWGADSGLLPNVEVVLSDKIATSSNPVAQIQGQIDALAQQIGNIADVRAIGDKIYLRKDGVEDYSNSPTRFSQEVSSRNFKQGIIGGQGWGLLTDENGNSVAEVDILKVRQEMQVNNLVVNQITTMGGKEILSAASLTISRVEDEFVSENEHNDNDAYVCYFDTHDGTIANLFQVNDIAYSQMFDSNNLEMKSYKRRVLAVGENFIKLTRYENNGEGAPQVGDVVVHYGNTTDTSRQYVIIRDVIGGGYERMLSGLDSVASSGTEYYFAGRMEGDTPRWFVGGAEGYAEWKNGTLKLKGQLEVNAQVGEGTTIIDGGMVSSDKIVLGNSAGISGTGKGGDSVRFWAGGGYTTWFGWHNEQSNTTFYTKVLPSESEYAVVDIYDAPKDTNLVYEKTPISARTFQIADDRYNYDRNYNVGIIDENTPFRVNNDGSLYASKGTFAGGMVVKYTKVGGVVDLYDLQERNLLATGGGGYPTQLPLPNDTAFIGTVLNLVCPMRVTRGSAYWQITVEDNGVIFHPKYYEVDEDTGIKRMKPITEIMFQDMGHIQLTCMPNIYYGDSSYEGEVTWLVTQDNSIDLTLNGTTQLTK